MSVPVVLRRRFKEDLIAGFDWYESLQPGLGEAFLTSVEAILSSIGLYPEIYAVIYGEVRRAIIPRFPFAIFYIVEAERTVALRLLHTARDPRVWPKSGE